MTTAEPTPNSAADIALSVSNAKAQITAAQQKCWIAIKAATKAAEKVRDEEERAPERALSELLEKFQEKAKEMATDNGSCPRERWGGYMEPSDITVREDGLHLSWDINGDYAPAQFLASWEALLKGGATQALA